MIRRPREWTIRSRITLLTAGLVFAAGLVIVVGGYWWLTTQLPEAAVEIDGGRIAVAIDQGAPIEVPDAVLGPSVVGPTGAEPPVSQEGPPVADIVSEAVSSASQQLAEEVARRAAAQSAALLALLTVMALGIGWFAARRALAPVHDMTRSAGRMESASLSDRLAVDGPDDEIREMGVTFNAMLDRVETTVRGEQRLIANMSHELRTPLANQRAVLELALEDQGDEGQELRHAVRTALDQNIRANRLIEQLLVLSRVEQGPHDARDDAVVDLTELCERLASTPAALTASNSGVQLVLNAASPVHVRGDSVLFERLVGNLVENAVRYNVEGGRVWLQVGMDGGRAEVRVTNTGPIVPAAELAGLCQPFRRGSADGAADRVISSEGTGLGLSLVDAIARRYDVTVRMDARPEGGLHVVLLWPKESAPMAHRP